MNVPARLAAFGLAALVVFGAGAAIGVVAGPAPDPAPSTPAQGHAHSDGESHP